MLGEACVTLFRERAADAGFLGGSVRLCWITQLRLDACPPYPEVGSSRRSAGVELPATQVELGVKGYERPVARSCDRMMLDRTPERCSGGVPRYDAVPD